MGKTTTTCGDGHGDDLLPLFLLPEDFLIQEILVCLPVKSLLRFKSVCKSWRELINTSYFIDLHTTFNSSSSSKFGGTFILQTFEPSNEKLEDDIKLYMLSSESGSTGDHGEDNDNDDDDDDHQKKTVFKVDDLGFSSFYNDFLLTESLRMVGSCNGIICLHDPMLMDVSKGISQQCYSNLRDVFLWNPATRQFRILPKSIPVEEKQDYMDSWLEDFIGFGFDVKTKDYKVLRITPWYELEEGGCMCRVQVYSLSTDSWRLLEGINYLPVVINQEMVQNSGMYLNGSYFFVGNKSGTETCVFMLLSFDFTKEIFTTMQLPDNNSHVLSSLGEKLAVFTAAPQIDDHYWYYDIWVLNEQQGSSSQGVVDNESSWTKLHTFRIESSRGPSNDTQLGYASHTEPGYASDDTQLGYASHTEPGYASDDTQLGYASYTEPGYASDDTQLGYASHTEPGYASYDTQLGYASYTEPGYASYDTQLGYASYTEPGYASYTEPRCISNNGEFALISTGRTYDDVGFSRNKLQLFNLITKEAKKDFTIGTRNCRADVYKESLVSIMGGGNVE